MPFKRKQCESTERQLRGDVNTICADSRARFFGNCLFKFSQANNVIQFAKFSADLTHHRRGKRYSKIINSHEKRIKHSLFTGCAYWLNVQRLHHSTHTLWHTPTHLHCLILFCVCLQLTRWAHWAIGIVNGVAPVRQVFAFLKVHQTLERLDNV